MLEPRSTGAEARRIPLSSLAPLMSSARLLLIDDDARLTGMVGDYLRSAGFEVSDRITVAWTAEGQLAEALQVHGDFIAGEVLATSFGAGTGTGHTVADDELGFVATIARNA